MADGTRDHPQRGLASNNPPVQVITVDGRIDRRTERIVARSLYRQRRRVITSDTNGLEKVDAFYCVALAVSML